MDTHETEDNTDEQALTRSPRSSHQISRRDFNGTSLEVGGAATAALVAQTRADIEARWIMAMRCPRNLDDVRQSLLAECKRPGFAEVAVYARPVGRAKDERTGEWKQVYAEGLSIRFAEAAMRIMGNMACEVVTIHDADDARTVRVTVTDFETNAMWRKDLTVKKTVERRQLKKGQQALSRRLNSYGDPVFIVEATDDETTVKEAALVSKAARTGILRVVPGNLQDEAKALCKRIAADKEAKDPDAARVRMLDAFATVGVRPSDLEEFIGHTTERLAPAEMAQLRAIYAAIESGEATWAEVTADKEAKPAAPASAAPASTSAPAVPQKTPDQPTQPIKKPSGKGTSALKEQLKPQPSEPSAFDKAAAEARAKEAARKEAEREPGWMSGEKATEATEERTCAKCGVPIEVPTSDPPGAQCYACSQS